MKNTIYPAIQILIVVLIASIQVFAQEQRELAVGQASAIIDLKTKAGTDAVKATWSFLAAQIEKTNFKSPGPSEKDPMALYPTGASIPTFQINPKAGTPAFESARWEIIPPDDLEKRRGTGLLSYVWYRLNIVLPEKVGKTEIARSTIIFEIVADDYSEIRVNGKLGKTFGQHGNGTVSGWNSRNRVLLTDQAKPGQTFELAILVANGPFADLPENYIWLRTATLDVYKKYPSSFDQTTVGRIERKEPKLDEILATDAVIEKLADGFQFTEGPVWHPSGYLLFSDPNTNVIYRYEPKNHNISIYQSKSGYSGFDIGDYHQPGSNGLAIDNEGRLVVCQHGNRRVVRHEVKGPVTVLSDGYKGQKLNSPNDLVFKSDGVLYFTDPPYGLPKNYTDPAKQTPHQGVYRIKNGQTELLSTDLGGPNGLAFSPDERYLYVANWDIRDIQHTKTLWRYEVAPDGTLKNGAVFFDFGFTLGDEALDGVKVDQKGNMFVSAPGGVWILSPEAKILGVLQVAERPANMAWGDADGKTLYLTAHTGLYKIRTQTGGKIAASTQQH